MKTLHAVFALGLSVAAVGGAAFAASPSSPQPGTTGAADTWLTIPGVYDRLTASGYTEIVKIERERNGYEVKATGPTGERVKIYVDPVTGEVLDSRIKRDMRDRRDLRSDAGAAHGNPVTKR